MYIKKINKLMETKIALFNVSKKIIDLIDTKKFQVMEFNNFEKMILSLKNIKVLIVDLEQKMNFKEFFKSVKSINENILILGLISFNRLRIATKLLKDDLTDYMIQDNIENLSDINTRLEQIINNSQKKTDKMKNISMFEFVNLNSDI